jgi:hypothetical protein
MDIYKLSNGTTRLNEARASRLRRRQHEQGLAAGVRADEGQSGRSANICVVVASRSMFSRSWQIGFQIASGEVLSPSINPSPSFSCFFLHYL